MSIRMTILCENSVERVSPTGLLGEHGFACYLETEQGNFLFDTGSGDTIIANSSKLGIPLKQTNSIILSHGHRDHTGGLSSILRLLPPVAVYAHPDLFLTRYSGAVGQLREIGIPFSKQDLEKMGAEFRLDRAPLQVATGLLFSGEIPRLNDFELADPKLLALASTGEAVQDRLADDAALFIDTPNGLIILLGCAHAGVLNVIDYARKVTGQSKIHMLLGGTHLSFCSEAQLTETLNQLESLEIDRIGVSHCTGLRQSQRIAERFGESFFHATVGTQIEINF